MITIYGIANCDTVKKARTWLAEDGIEYDFHDFKKSGLTAGLLQGWSKAIGWDRLINRQGTTWRKLDDASRQMADSPAGAEKLVLAHPSLIKRPVAQWGNCGEVTVGFDAHRWSALAAQVKSVPRM